MLKHLTGSLLGLALLVPAAQAQSSPGVPLTVEPQSRLWIEGTSTVRGFKCDAAGLDASVLASGDQAPAAVLAGTKAVRTAEVLVPAAKLDCGNGTMNGHMQKALKAAQHPEITFKLTSYELAPQAQGATLVKMNGRLLLGGTEKLIALQADASQGPGGVLRVAGRTEIKMSEFGLKAPTLMMGTMRVNDRVMVHYDLTLKQ